MKVLYIVVPKCIKTQICQFNCGAIEVHVSLTLDFVALTIGKCWWNAHTKIYAVWIAQAGPSISIVLLMSRWARYAVEDPAR